MKSLSEMRVISKASYHIISPLEVVRMVIQTVILRSDVTEFLLRAVAYPVPPPLSYHR